MSEELVSVAKRDPKHHQYTHGMTGTPFFNRYYTIKQRTGNPNSHKYQTYGARGITCEWKTFEDLKRDMYDEYVEHVIKHGERNTTIERVDNNKSYCKANCRWATPLEQAQNTRNTKLIDYDGQTMSQSAWERELGICRGMIRYHQNKGLTISEIMNKYNYGK